MAASCSGRVPGGCSAATGARWHSVASGYGSLACLRIQLLNHQVARSLACCWGLAPSHPLPKGQRLRAPCYALCGFW